jgi:hypothetical protein
MAMGFMQQKRIHLLNIAKPESVEAVPLPEFQNGRLELGNNSF